VAIHLDATGSVRIGTGFVVPPVGFAIVKLIFVDAIAFVGFINVLRKKEKKKESI
jgi:hypothetical protein